MRCSMLGLPSAALVGVDVPGGCSLLSLLSPWWVLLSVRCVLCRHVVLGIVATRHGAALPCPFRALFACPRHMAARVHAVHAHRTWQRRVGAAAMRVCVGGSQQL